MHSKIYHYKTTNKIINTKHKKRVMKKHENGQIAFDFDEVVILCKISNWLARKYLCNAR